MIALNLMNELKVLFGKTVSKVSCDVIFLSTRSMFFFFLQVKLLLKIMLQFQFFFVHSFPYLHYFFTDLLLLLVFIIRVVTWNPFNFCTLLWNVSFSNIWASGILDLSRVQASSIDTVMVFYQNMIMPLYHVQSFQCVYVSHY